jgi:ParB-like chromosome segregation protein Spo0J
MMTPAERAKGRFMRAPDHGSDGKGFTQADIDAAVKAATDKVQESIDRLEAKNTELVGDLRKARKAGEIKPEDLAAAEDRADKAEAALAAANKSLKERRPRREGDQGARNRAGRGPLLCARRRDHAGDRSGQCRSRAGPAFTAMVKQQAKADLVDGKYAVSIGDKAAKDYITEFLGTEEGKRSRLLLSTAAAALPAAAAMAAAARRCCAQPSRCLPAVEQHAFTVKEGGKVVDA